MFDSLEAAQRARGAEALTLLDRLENAASAAKLSALVGLLDNAHAAAGSVERESWLVDNWAAVCAQGAAALGVSRQLASSMLRTGLTVRDRLPKTGAVFARGLISRSLVSLIAYRTALLTDPDTLRAVDTELAARVARWGKLSYTKQQKQLDEIIATHDPLAVREAKETAKTRDVTFDDDERTGFTNMHALLLGQTGAALEQVIAKLIKTVCGNDPRSVGELRADALEALAYRNDRMACLCGSQDCDSYTRPPATGVVVHLIYPGGTQPGSSGAEGDGPDGSDPDVDDDPDDDQGDPGGPDGPSDPEPDPSTPSSADRPTDESTDGATDDATDEPGKCPDEEHDEQDVKAAADAERLRQAYELAQRLRRRPTLFEQANVLPGLAELDAQPPPERPPGPPPTPSYLQGRGILPAPLARQALRGAKIRPIIHPGLAPPEPRYRPSRALADYVRHRDLTCRAPGCTVSAWACDLDHAIPWPYGCTCASNLRCLCRFHHLLRTFWDWTDVQHPDGRIDWKDPTGHVTTTLPGSYFLYPDLCAPTAPIPHVEVPKPEGRTMKMPKRSTTRAIARAHRINAERTRNAHDPARQPIPPPF